jgi:hypothetical protein
MIPSSISVNMDSRTYNVKATKAVSGTAHQSISEAIANGRIPQNSAKVCL